MTWFTTWPTATGPAYEAHDTEAQAEAHAKELVDSRRGDRRDLLQRRSA